MCGNRPGFAFVSTWLAVLAAELLAGCGSGSAPPAGPQAHRFAGLEFALFSDQPVYSSGQIVPLTLTITNLTGASIAYTNTNATPVYTMLAARSGQVIRICPEVFVEQIHTLTFAPATPVALTCAWDQRLPNGGRVAPGVYQIQAYVGPGTVNGVTYTQQEAQAELAANPVQITISPH